MDLKAMFPSTVSGWVKYSHYNIIDIDSDRMVVPTDWSRPIIYNPLENAVGTLVDLLNVGAMPSNGIPEYESLYSFVVLHQVKKFFFPHHL